MPDAWVLFIVCPVGPEASLNDSAGNSDEKLIYVQHDTISHLSQLSHP